MYLLGRIMDSKGANTMIVELPKGCIGLMPIFKTEEDAKKDGNHSTVVYELEELS